MTLVHPEAGRGGGGWPGASRGLSDWEGHQLHSQVEPGLLRLPPPVPTQPFSSPCLKGALESHRATASFSDLEILYHRPQTRPSAFMTGALMMSAPQPHQSAWGTSPFSVLSATDKTWAQEKKQPRLLAFIPGASSLATHAGTVGGLAEPASVPQWWPWVPAEDAQWGHTGVTGHSTRGRLDLSRNPDGDI